MQKCEIHVPRLYGRKGAELRNWPRLTLSTAFPILYTPTFFKYRLQEFIRPSDT